jgi:hypothetical protein
MSLAPMSPAVSVMEHIIIQSLHPKLGVQRWEHNCLNKSTKAFASCHLVWWYSGEEVISQTIVQNVF